jgi:hypothetical protein
MKNYVFVYHSGATPRDFTKEEMEQIGKAWMDWFGSLGSAVVDAGNPFGESKAIGKSGEQAPKDKASGYSIIKADDMAAAFEIAKSCPLLNDPGEPVVEVYETLPM